VITSSSENNKESANQIITEINTASENIGFSIKAGTTKAGYDCSGLVYSLF
jgi:hypothetical protein